jgi:MoaA/NifB/PqqE/SkfB family radical SAM enzyme
MSVLDRAYFQARILKVPFNVHFDLTYRCHQRCVHCYIPEGWRRGQGPAEGDIGQIKSILDQLAAAGTFFLHFSGGEVFLRPDLMDLVYYARRLNFAVSLMTSGGIGPVDEQIDVLAEVGIDSLQMSCYSLDQVVHDRVTGVSGSWSRLMETMDKCRVRGIRVIFNAVIFSFTFDQIRAIERFSREEDIYLRMDGTLVPRWDGKLFPTGLAINPESNRELHNILGTSMRNWQESLTVPFAPEVSADLKGCEAGQTICYITPQGNLWPCMDIPYNCGKVIGEAKFNKIWNDSFKLNAIRAMHGHIPESERLCDYWRRTSREKILDQFS